MTGYEHIRNDFAGKKILLLGLGVLGGGIDTVKFFRSLNCQVSLTDLRSAEELQPTLAQINLDGIGCTFGQHDPEDLKKCDVVIRNPAVPQDSPFLVQAREWGKEIYMDAALFAKYTQTPIIGITGTRGKSTTTTLIYEILKQVAGGKIALGGNVPGISSLSLLRQETKDTYFTVMELSSWQLQGFADLKISPHIAVFTNIYPDHLNRYHSMSDYIKDKTAITAHQSQADHFVYNRHDPVVVDIAQTTHAQTHPFGAEDLDASIHLQLMGEHNRENAAAALKVAQILSLPSSAVSAVLSHQTPLAFRLEPIKTFQGVTYINDTTSTTPTALIMAIKALTRPATVIAGGQSKNLPLDEVIDTLNFHPMVKRIILLPGTGTDEIKDRLDKKRLIGLSTTLDEAVTESFNLTRSGEDVLFSPGFTSFSQYQNEFQRGEHFNRLVGALI